MSEGEVPYRVVISLVDGRRLVRTFDNRSGALAALENRFDLARAKKIGHMVIEDESGGAKVRIVLNPDCIVSLVAEPIHMNAIDRGMLQ